ncbi:MAG: hypothetical protein VX583_13255 [Bdellovibrionota bacterium]|nr:hypothetical protein [Pseudobdellovibrionaceae bacterium]|tara:strand:- start:4430 stop:4813 length:384 start_codon:yes stop_codon:yes gene_type:complete
MLMNAFEKDWIQLCDGYIHYTEKKDPSHEEIESSFNYLQALIHEFGITKILVDISDSNKPNAELRDLLKRKWLELQDQLEQVAVVTGENVLLNTTAKFIIRGIGLKGFSLHRDSIEACVALGVWRRI